MVATATPDAGASQPKPLGLDVPQGLTRLFLVFFRKSIQCLDHNLYNTVGESGLHSVFKHILTSIAICMNEEKQTIASHQVRLYGRMR